MFTGKIKSYGDILLYFCEIGNMKKYLTLVYMAHVNGYKLNLTNILDLTNIALVNGL